MGLAAMVAELVNDPKRPNTNPAMAMAAMSVIAIGITVAMTLPVTWVQIVLTTAIHRLVRQHSSLLFPNPAWMTCLALSYVLPSYPALQTTARGKAAPG
jgi:hypothetical protein